MTLQPRRLAPGDTVHGFAGGLFGRDHYHCCTVEANGRDWAVFREVDGDAVSFLAGDKDLRHALDHLKPIPGTPYTNGCGCLAEPPECP